MKKLFRVILFFTFLIFRPMVSFTQMPGDATAAKNVILILATGMGDHQYRVLQAIAEQEQRPLVLDDFDRKLRMKTSILDSALPDTPGGASTLATGQKCPPGILSVSPDGKPLLTILERAQQSGRSVGLVTSGDLTQGAITAFAVHSATANDLELRARQLFDARIQVLVGADQEIFEKAKNEKGISLLTGMKEAGYTLALGSQLELIRARETPIAAFFKHRFRVDCPYYPNEPGLQQIMFKALSILNQNPKGFFLIVETAGIDYSCRIGDPVGLAYELLELDESVEAALRFAKAFSRTLIVVISPHETGNFLTVEDFLPRFAKDFQTIHCSPVYLDSELGKVNDAGSILSAFRDKSGINFLESYELADVSRAKPGIDRIKIIAQIIAHHFPGGNFAQDTPSGRSVPCFVQGPGSDQWPENFENDEFAGLLSQTLGLP